MSNGDLKSVIESLLFVCDEPLSLNRAAEVLEKSEAEVKAAFLELAEDLKKQDRGIQLRATAGGYRLFTHPGHAAHVEKLVLRWDSRRLTQAALETLAIIAYKQPVTKISINAIRGVSSDAAVTSLMSKGLVRDLGREKSPGAPVLYGTTAMFLEKFGLNSIKDLPSLKDFEPEPSVRGEIETALKDEG